LEARGSHGISVFFRLIDSGDLGENRVSEKGCPKEIGKTGKV